MEVDVTGDYSGRVYDRATQIHRLYKNTRTGERPSLSVAQKGKTKKWSSTKPSEGDCIPVPIEISGGAEASQLLLAVQSVLYVGKHPVRLHAHASV